MRSVLLALLILLATAGTASAASGPCYPGGPSCHYWYGKVTFIADGDTIDVSTGGHVYRVRITGLNAMEMTRYSKYPSRRRGDCHAVAATARIEQLLRAGHLRVRMAAQDVRSHSNKRIRRQISTNIGGQWVDVARILVAEGHALWLPNGTEWAWNTDYRLLAEHARYTGLRLWDPRGCGAGPSPDANLSIRLNYDADGNDRYNVNGEWARIYNPTGAPVSLAHWWFRDSALRRYTFPAWAVIPARGSVMLRMGRGQSSGTMFHWGLATPPFENPTFDRRDAGDGAYLFDPRGNLRASVIYP